MCLPAVALPVAAAAVSAAGSLVNGYAGMQQGNYEAALARRNAALQTEAATDSIARGRDEALQYYRQLGQVKGQQAASLAANNIDPGFGTAATLQDDTARMGSEDMARLYRNVYERTRGFDIGAANYRSEAAAARYRGQVGMLNSVLQAGSSLMSGFSQQAAMRARLGLTGG